jgi:hypothetical protein
MTRGIPPGIRQGTVRVSFGALCGTGIPKIKKNVPFNVQHFIHQECL